jgi:hypothetical protein
LNIIKSIRGKSGKTYIVNEVFLRAEKLYEPTQIAVSPTRDSRITTTLKETLPIDIPVNNIGKIVKSFAGDTQKILDELSKLPLEELKSETVNVYLCKQAIQLKEDKERESKATYVSGDKILSALSRIKKQANPRYREKVEYNKRNNLNWKGEPNK